MRVNRSNASLLLLQICFAVAAAAGRSPPVGGSATKLRPFTPWDEAAPTSSNHHDHLRRQLASSCDDVGDHVAASGGSGGCCYWTGWAWSTDSCESGYTEVNEDWNSWKTKERKECCRGPGFEACISHCTGSNADYCHWGCSFRAKGGAFDGLSQADCDSKCVSRSA